MGEDVVRCLLFKLEEVEPVKHLVQLDSEQLLLAPLSTVICAMFGGDPRPSASPKIKRSPGCCRVNTTFLHPWNWENLKFWAKERLEMETNYRDLNPSTVYFQMEPVLLLVKHSGDHVMCRQAVVHGLFGLNSIYFSGRPYLFWGLILHQQTTSYH